MTQVQSLVGELRSRKLRGVANKKNNNKIKSNKALTFKNKVK